MSTSRSQRCQAHAWDVDWIDAHGPARVCGFLVPQSDVRDRVQPGDRTATGRLTAQAKERIAGELTQALQHIDQTARSHRAEPSVPMVLRDCDG